MYSQEYERAKKEYINCMIFGIICFGIPFYIAHTEWKPIMKREKEKALTQARNAGQKDEGIVHQ